MSESATTVISGQAGVTTEERIPPALLAMILPQPIFYLEEDGYGTVGQVREGLSRIAALAASETMAPSAGSDGALPPPPVAGPGGQMTWAAPPTPKAATPRVSPGPDGGPETVATFPDVAGGILFLMEGRRTPLTPAASKMMTDLTTALALPADLMRVVPVDAKTLPTPPVEGLKARFFLLMGWPREALERVWVAGGQPGPVSPDQPLTLGAARVVATLHPNALAQDKDAKRVLWRALKP